MIRKSALIAGAMVLAFGILPSPATVMAHGHGGGHHHNNHDHDNGDYNYNSDEFWSGPEVHDVVIFEGSDANADSCTNLNDRLNYPGLCPDDD
jgi:hypothetical protein